ncbi:MAG TPA: VOC family protein [Spirochaetia bacterium]|nr:VOC family protein [Spirochaetia bacterium]
MNEPRDDNRLSAGALPLPAGHNTVNGFIVVKGAAEFLEFVCEVFEGTENVPVRTPDRDGTLIHAEVRIGTSTIMVADTKPGWPSLHALTQVYVKDAQAVLTCAVERGGRVVTEVTPFYNRVSIARFLDRWGNLWWLFEPQTEPASEEPVSDVSWHRKEPSYVYRTLMETMSKLSDDSPRST